MESEDQQVPGATARGSTWVGLTCLILLGACPQLPDVEVFAFPCDNVSLCAIGWSCGCGGVCVRDGGTPQSCCGDEQVDEGEDCDDGNVTDGDGCSATCQTEEDDGCGEVVTYKDHAYYVCATRKRWGDAQVTCSAPGWSLTQPDDQDEDAFVLGLLGQNGSDVGWIRLKKDELQGVYTHWSSTKPDENGDCVITRPIGWSNEYCDDDGQIYAFVCESTEAAAIPCKSVSLDGMSGGVEVQQDDDFDLGGSSFTVEAWVYNDGYTGKWGTIVAKGESSESPHEWWLSRSNDRKSYRFFIKGGDGTAVDLEADDPGIGWNHVAATYDAYAQITILWVNGEERARHTGVLPEVKNRGHLSIGYDGPQGYHFKGLIDSVHISSTPRYVTQFYPPVNFGADTYTVGLWNMTGEGDVVTDASQGAHHGKLTGGSWAEGGVACQATTGSSIKAHYALGDVVTDRVTGAEGRGRDVVSTEGANGEPAQGTLFDGSAQDIITWTGYSLDQTGGFSAALWFKASAGGNEATTMLSAKNDVSAAHLYLGINPPTGELLFKATDAEGHWVYWTCQDLTYTQDRWHHVGVVWTGGNEAEALVIFVDGARCQEMKHDQSGEVNDLVVHTVGLGGLLGAGETASKYFSGVIDDVFIYGRPASRSELLLLKQGVFTNWPNTWTQTFFDDFIGDALSGWSSENGGCDGQETEDFEGTSVWVMDSDWNHLRREIDGFVPSTTAGIALETSVYVERTADGNIPEGQVQWRSNYRSFNQNDYAGYLLWWAHHNVQEPYEFFLGVGGGNQEDTFSLLNRTQGTAFKGGRWLRFRSEEFAGRYRLYLDDVLAMEGSTQDAPYAGTQLAFHANEGPGYACSTQPLRIDYVRIMTAP